MAFVNLMDIVYPVGSVYMSTTNVSPANTIGGTWTAIEDKFLKGANATNNNVLTTGGNNELKLNNTNLPSHSHNIVTLWNGSWYNVTLQLSNASGGSDWPVASWTAQKSKGLDGRLSSGLATDPSQAEDYPNNPFNNQPAFVTVYIWYRTA